MTGSLRKPGTDREFMGVALYGFLLSRLGTTVAVIVSYNKAVKTNKTSVVFINTDVRPVSYVALSSNLIQTNLIERIKCDGSASYETN